MVLVYQKKIVTIQPPRHKPAAIRQAGTQRRDKYKLNNGVFSLMSLRLINFNVPHINAPEAH